MKESCKPRAGIMPAIRPLSVAVLACVAGAITPTFAQPAPANPAESRAEASRTPTRDEVTRSAAAVTDPSGRSEDDVVILSPFQVNSERDTGYSATSTLAGTRLRSDLKDLAASISVVTKDFMSDINASDFGSLLTYTLGTEVGGPSGNFSGTQNFGGVYDDAMAEATTSTRVRGLMSADVTRDYFLTDTPMDSYIVERVEISRGPNSMLFGLGSPAGIVNSSLIKADTRRHRSEVGTQFGSYGSQRYTLDHNQVLIPNVLAVRVAGLYSDSRYRIEEAFERRKGAFLTTTYRPFAGTTIRANAEWGRSDSNRPEMRPPFDNYTLWWDLGKPVFNPVTQVGHLLGTPAPGYPNAFNANGAISSTNIITTGLGDARGNIPVIVYSDPRSEAMGIPGTPYEGLKPNGTGFYGSVTSTNQGMRQLQSMTNFLRNVTQVNHVGRLAFNEPQLTDPEIFDFYHHMLHGPTKYEWAEWHNYNAVFEQTFFDNKAGLELVLDKQGVDFGHMAPLAYRIYIDINETLPNGAPNPNLGRPYTSGSGGFVRRHSRDREAGRLSGFYDLDLHKVGPNWLGRILGRHTFNGNHMQQEAFQEVKGGMSMGNGLDYTAAESQTPGTVSSTGRALYRIHYLGDNMSGTSAPGQVGPIQAMQFPWNDQSATFLFNNRPVAGQAAPSPWVTRDLSIVTNPREDVAETSRASYLSRTVTNIHSTALTLQSRWFENNVVTTFGWRRDDVKTFSAGAAPTDPATGIGIDDWDIYYPLPATSASEESRSFGIVVHTPGFVRRRLPAGTNLSLFFNDASNFRVTGQRYDITGRAIGPEVGDTKEIGFRFSTFNNRFEVRFAHFETTAGAATISSFVGSFNDIADTIGDIITRNAAGQNSGNPEGIAAFEQWLQTPFAQNYLSTFNYALIRNPNPTPTTGSYASSSHDRRSGQIVGTSALTSKGEELELVFNPTRNWRIAANVGRAEAIRTNISPEFQTFINEMNQVLMTDPTLRPIQATAMGALSSNDTENWAGRQVSRVINLTLPTFLEDGSPTSELREWRFNAVTNYNFTSGRLKGWSVGANVRWQDKGAIGFPYHTVEGQNLPDVKNPYMAPAMTTWGANIGYRRKLWRNIDWNVRLYVNNIGVGNELIPIGAQPDGSIARWMIREPQKWTVSNSFKF